MAGKFAGVIATGKRFPACVFTGKEPFVLLRLIASAFSAAHLLLLLTAVAGAFVCYGTGVALAFVTDFLALMLAAVQELLAFLLARFAFVHFTTA